MSNINPDREHRVIERGEALSLKALELAASTWPEGNPNVPAEAMEYLVEAIIQFAIHHENPQPVLDLVIEDLRGVDAKQRRASAIARLKKAPQ